LAIIGPVGGRSGNHHLVGMPRQAAWVRHVIRKSAAAQDPRTGCPF
jgi:hypothetical protein